MCLLFRSRDEFQRNRKEYVKNKFGFLIGRGYRYEFFSRNGEYAFSFTKRNLRITIFYDSYPEMASAAVYYDTTGSAWKGVNLAELVAGLDGALMGLSGKGKIDLLAGETEKRLEEIEKEYLR